MDKKLSLQFLSREKKVDNLSMALHDYFSPIASLQELSFFAFSFFSKIFKPAKFQYLTNYINTCVTFVQFHIICHGNVY